jgi:UTP-glucose-1-phosphate uridylyltransferase
MLPIGDRLLIDYAIEDCITAGITDIMFVVDEESGQIRTIGCRTS